MHLSSNSAVQDRLQNGNNLLHTCTNQTEAENLVASGVNVNGLNYAGQTPLHSLMRLGNPATIPVVLYLLSLEDVDVNVAEPDGTTIAHLCEWGPIMTRLVRREDFDPNKIRHSDGNTPLMFAVSYPKHPDIVRRLLRDSRLNFALPNSKNGKTALHLAYENRGGEYGSLNLELIINEITARTHLTNDQQSSYTSPLTNEFLSNYMSSLELLDDSAAPPSPSASNTTASNNTMTRSNDDVSPTSRANRCRGCNLQ